MVLDVVLDNITVLMVLQLKVDVLQALAHPGLHLLSHRNEENENLLLTVSIKNAISLVLSEIVLDIVLSKKCFIFFLGCLVTIIHVLGDLVDELPHLFLGGNIIGLNVVTLEHVCKIKTL